MSADTKKPLTTGELHFGVRMRINEAAEYLQRLTDKGILVYTDKAAPTEHRLHLEFHDDEPTTIYVRLSQWDTIRTRVDLSLSKGFHIPSKVYKVLGGVLVFMVLEFLIHRSIEVSLMLFALVFALAIKFSDFFINDSALIDRRLMSDNLARRRADYIMDAVVELFKSKGAIIILE